jgi:SpoVK/Ycf46/Vps4 family AAA+-type ATPase
MESRCTVLFFDEIDALGQSRGVSGMPSSEQSGGGGDVSSRRLLAELLIQLNRINSSNGSISDDDHGGGEDDQYPVGDEESSVDTVYQDHDYDAASIHQDEGPQRNRARVIVVAATNRPEDCDPALVRRFAVRVCVGLPSNRDRKKILNRYLGDVAHNITRSQLDGVAAMTDGWSGSDLESLTREAAMAPIRECIRAAALLKRRIRRGEQSGGHSSCEEDQADADHHEQARDTLLQHFKTLRQVNVQDFRDAIAFWMGNHSCDGNSQFGGLDDSRRLTHYDSSSDEDD